MDKFKSGVLAIFFILFVMIGYYLFVFVPNREDQIRKDKETKEILLQTTKENLAAEERNQALLETYRKECTKDSDSRKDVFTKGFGVCTSNYSQEYCMTTGGYGEFMKTFGDEWIISCMHQKDRIYK